MAKIKMTKLSIINDIKFDVTVYTCKIVHVDSTGSSKVRSNDICVFGNKIRESLPMGKHVNCNVQCLVENVKEMGESMIFNN